MGYVINLLNFPIIAKKSSFSFVPLPMKLGIRILISFRCQHLYLLMLQCLLYIELYVERLIV
ncbi:MAG: hypothetical protein ACR5K9_07230 [Wolbachia sp.]